MTLGCGIISKNNELEGLNRALASVHKHVDQIYITIADRLPPTDEVKKLSEKYDAVLSFFQWENRYDHEDFNMDFAAARNFNMNQCNEDWYVWLDSDDEVTGLKKAKGYLKKVPKNVKYILCTYNYAFFPSGEVENSHPKERFIKMNESFSWKGALHENCVTDHKVDGVFLEDIVWHHRTNKERSTDSCFRNIKIVEKELSEMIEKGDKKDVDPRTVFNLGMAYSSYAQKTDTDQDWENAIRAFHKYLELSGWDEHAFMAWRFIGNAQMRLQRPILALGAFFECLKINPGYKDGYASLGAAYLQLNDKERAKHWFKLALIAGEENKYLSDRRTTVYMPLMSLAEIYALEGKIDDAEQFLKFGLQELKLKDENMEEMYKEIKRTKKFLKQAEKERDRIKALPKEERKAAFDQLDGKLKSTPVLIQYRRSENWTDAPTGKDIVIHTGVGWEEWNPDMEKTGVGGSEEAVINMAKLLVKKGWNVKVYGNHGLERKTYEGVEYIPYWEWSPHEPTNIFIAWRDPTLLDIDPIADQKYVWLHDTNPESVFTPTRLERVNKIFVLSQYHRSLYPNIPDEKFIVSANGLNPKHFEGIAEEKRDKNKCMYISAPNRGLLTLLEMWPKIRESCHEAELYWAYGWDTYDIMMKTNPSARAYKEACVKLLDQPGVHELGRIGHEELAEHLKTTNVWVYPTEFTEIFCISAIKAQAAGAVPVTTNVAALDETVQYGKKLAVSDISTNTETQHNFICHVIDLIRNGYTERDKMIEWARNSWDWENVAHQWDKIFSNVQ